MRLGNKQGKVVLLGQSEKVTQYYVSEYNVKRVQKVSMIKSNQSFILF